MSEIVEWAIKIAFALFCWPFLIAAWVGLKLPYGDRWAFMIVLSVGVIGTVHWWGFVLSVLWRMI